MSFESFDADSGTALVRLRLAEGDERLSESRLSITIAGRVLDRQEPLPNPGASPAETGTVTFVVDAGLLERSGARFELALGEAVAELPAPVPTAVSEARRDVAAKRPRGRAKPTEHAAALNRKVDALRHELRETRERLGEAEQRAEAAYANQVMAEERSMEAHATARELEKRAADLAAEIEAQREAGDVLAQQLAATGQCLGHAEERLAAQRAESVRLAEECRRLEDALAYDEVSRLRAELELVRAAAAALEAEFHRTLAEAAGGQPSI
jgi:hypothetical protein